MRADGCGGVPQRSGWFEVSDAGWNQRAAQKSLGRLLLEAVQNSFDAQARLVSVEIGEHGIVVEDNAVGGVLDERLIYTLFLTDKSEQPRQRGRMGRGLKELLGAAERATVETVGKTLHFDPGGRRVVLNERATGTRIALSGIYSLAEQADAAQLLRMCIPPRGTTLRVDGRVVRRPRRAFALPGCELETVITSEGRERSARGMGEVSLYAPHRGHIPHILEMGIPVQPWNAPWHVDVGQRVPLDEGRGQVADRFQLHLKATLLEAMMSRYLDRADLRSDWVMEVLAKWTLKASVLEAYVAKMFPRGAVLDGTRRGNDRARQLGAHVVDANSLSYGAYLTLGRVLEASDDYVRRRSADLIGDDVEPDAAQLRFAAVVRWLARRLTGHSVSVRFFERDATDDGLLQDALTDVDARVLSFNVLGPLRFDDPTDPQTLGVILHELAHLEGAEHDHRYIDRLGGLAGAIGRLFGEGGPALLDALRRGDPDA